MPVKVDKLAGKKGGAQGERLTKFWLSQLEKWKDDVQQKRWTKRGETIEKRYRDERSRSDEDSARRYNALWSNVEILTPAIYGKCPVAIAERRFRDKDPIGRGASQIIERGLRNEIEVNGFHDAVSLAVRDYLLPGRGVVWVRYEPEFDEGVSVNTEGGMDLEDTQGIIEPKEAKEVEAEGNEAVTGENDEDGQDEEEEKLEETGDRIIRETCPVDYINWKDFVTFPTNARIWKEVTAVGKRVYMTRQQLRDRFGNEIGKDIPLKKDDRKNSPEGTDKDPSDKGVIYEIWSLSDRQVFWIAEGYSYLCDLKDDPLTLEGFFPVPRPISSNATTGTLFPVPDYIEYQDQAIQIDELTQRICMLSKACKVAGVYNSAAKDIQRLMQESVENELIPVDDWAAFAEEGGVAGNISFLPLKEIMGVLQELMTIKERQIQEMDRLTGITDIMRGTTDARETLGGQRLKSNSAGTRLQARQNEVARFCRDTVRIITDIMAQHFSDKSWIDQSGAMFEEGLGDVDPQSIPQHIMQQFQPPPMLPPPMPQLAPPQQQIAPPGNLGGAAGPMPQPPPNPQPPTGSNIVPFPGQQPPSAGAGQPPQPQVTPEMVAKMIGEERIKKALALIRNEKLRGFRVDIEVDSSIFGDAAQEKGDRTQFITAITQYLQQALMMSGQVPEITPLLGKFLQFGVRGFRVGRDLEAAIEDFCDEAVGIAKKKAEEAKSQPTPQMLTAQASMIKAKAADKGVDSKAKTDQMKMQSDAQKTASKVQSDREESQAEIQRQHIENQGEAQNNEAAMAEKQAEAQMAQQSHAHDMARGQMDMLIQSMQIQMEQQREAHETQMEGMRQQSEQMKLEHQSRMQDVQLEKANVQLDKAKKPPASNGG